MALWILNILLHWRHARTIGVHTPALASLARLLGCVERVFQTVQALDLSEVRDLGPLTQVAKEVRKRVSRLFLRAQGANDLALAAIEYLNVLCLFEVSFCCRAIVAVNAQRAALLRMMLLVGRLDAFQGLSSSLAEYPFLCVPESKPGRAFTLEDAYHPLVSSPVHNTIQGTGNSVLLSGTNMSGKTTFMKTVAVNLLFSQTVGLCLARRAVLPPARIKTLISREETMAEGQSYFFFEATELLRMVHDAERSGRDCWFVIDELFRGTNTVERVAAGSAVVRYLTRRWMVFASTHDQELATLLKHECDPYHFSERIDGDAARFDFLLRKGPSTSRNAIRLLTLAGYPKEVTDAADSLASSLKGERSAEL